MWSTRTQLGWGAVRYLLRMGKESWTEEGAMMSDPVRGDHPHPLLRHPQRGNRQDDRAPRNVNSNVYRNARSFMMRLERADFEDP